MGQRLNQAFCEGEKFKGELVDVESFVVERHAKQIGAAAAVVAWDGATGSGSGSLSLGRHRCHGVCLARRPRDDSETSAEYRAVTHGDHL